jgi:hypothetical protein
VQFDHLHRPNQLYVIAGTSQAQPHGPCALTPAGPAERRSDHSQRDDGRQRRVLTAPLSSRGLVIRVREEVPPEQSETKDEAANRSVAALSCPELIRSYHAHCQAHRLSFLICFNAGPVPTHGSRESERSPEAPHTAAGWAEATRR